VSACLLGDTVRYDAQSNELKQTLFQQWYAQGRFVAICPEVSGGLPIPRPPAEIEAGDGKDVLLNHASIISITGEDVTDAFVRGAKNALELAQKHNCQFAILAARSPSCGNETIYDGRFNGSLVKGQGVTAALLEQNNIRVFNQDQLGELQSLLDGLEAN
jgi:uncharacterized protein YbbK (DUF523 family)